MLVKSDSSIFLKSVEKSQVYSNRTRITGALHEDRYTFMIVSRSILLPMRNVCDKFVKKIKTHMFCSITFSRKSDRLWDNVEKYCIVVQATDDNKIRRMCIACRLLLATKAHPEYVANTYCFPQQQLFNERTSMLRKMNITCCVIKLMITCGCLWRRIFYKLD